MFKEHVLVLHTPASRHGAKNRDKCAAKLADAASFLSDAIAMEHRFSVRYRRALHESRLSSPLLSNSLCLLVVCRRSHRTSSVARLASRLS